MEWALMPLKRYADFKGRSRRKEYWLFALLIFVVTLIITALIFAMTGKPSPEATMTMSGPFATLMFVFGLLVLAIFIPSLAVQVRRFHDQDKSGWFVLLNFIPYVGGLVVLVFMCLDGTPGPNRFGEDPKAGERGII